MARRILVHIAALTAAQRERLTAAAAARGFETCFRDDRASALEAAGDAEILFTADAGLLDAAPKARWLCVPSAGAENYLKPVLEDRGGVRLSCSSGAYGVTIAEHIVMVTLTMFRRMGEYQAVVANRGWRRDLPIHSIRGARVTLLGTGDIGREAAIRLRAFGPASITGVNRRGRAPEGLFDAVYPIARLDEVLPRTDLLIMSLPHTPDTVGLMDAKRLGLLPRGAYLVNVGRGSVLDQTALVECLKAGALGGAALDVFVTEPPRPDDPVWDCPGLLFTPHVAGNMTLPYTVDRIVDLFIEDFERYCDGQPLIRDVALREGY